MYFRSHPGTFQQPLPWCSRTLPGLGLAGILLSLTATAFAASWQSSRITPSPNGRLLYAVDGEQNRIPDFSHAGYRGGGVPLPEVAVVKTLSPVAGDNTSHIQAAIDELETMEPDDNGFRGALLLQAGTYPVTATLRIEADGIVLRGAGNGSDPASNTIIRRTGTSTDDVIVAGGSGSTLWQAEIPGTRTDITTPFVPVGSRSFDVDDASPYAIGDNMTIHHPCTEEWLEAVDYGATHVDDPWTVNSQPLVFNRNITAIRGNTIHIDAPIFNHLDRSLSPSYIYKHNRSGFLREIGFEDFRVHIETNGETSEDHANSAIRFDRIDNAWAARVTTLHFVYSGFLLSTATRVTVKDCEALEPHSIVTGGRRYNFNVAPGQLCLFENCYASNGRHAFVGNGSSRDNGIVFLNSTSDAAHTSSEGHRRWGMGFLYDGIQEINVRYSGIRLIALYNRGSFGTGHGWSLAHSVAWGCDVGIGQLVVQKPPTAQNYAVGCFGAVDGNGPFEQPAGFIEGSSQSGLEPQSLYLAQLDERLRPRQVYLLIGEANMAGRGSVNPASAGTSGNSPIVAMDPDGNWIPAHDPLPHPDPAAGTGPGLSFARALLAADDSNPVGLIPFATGSTPIEWWQKNPEEDPNTLNLYARAIEQVRRALETGGVFKGILWHQGESNFDLANDTPATYQSLLHQLIADLRTDIAALDNSISAPDSIPFVTGTLAGALASPIDAISSGLPENVPTTAVAPSAGLTTSDGVHFTPAAAETLGLRYAAAMQELQQGTPHLLSHSFKSDPLTEGEPGHSIEISLARAPAANVVVSFAPDPELAVSPASLGFSPDDWHTPRIVTLSAIEDRAYEGNHSGTVGMSLSSSDPDFNLSDAGAWNAIVHERPLIAAYSFDDPADPGRDDQPGAFNGTATGFQIVEDPARGATLSLDGTDDTLAIPALPAAMNPGEGTIAAWVKWDGGDGLRRIFTHRNPNRAYLTAEDGNFAITLGAPNVNIPAGHAFAMNEWVHVSLAWNHGSFTTCVNGRRMTRGSYTDLDAFDQELAFMGSYNGTGEFWNGSIDELRVYSVSLPPAEVAKLILETTPGIIVANGGTDLAEGGTASAIQLRLATRPTAEVTISLTTSSQIQLSAPSVTFDPGNWETPRTLIVQAADDQIPEGRHSDTVGFAIESTQPAYDGLEIDPLIFHIEDNDFHPAPEFDPDGYASIGTIASDTSVLTFDTDTLSVSGGLGGSGQLATTPKGTEVAVFAFDAIDLQSPPNIAGSRPLVLISKSDLTVNATIDLDGGNSGHIQRGIARAGGFDGGHSIRDSAEPDFPGVHGKGPGGSEGHADTILSTDVARGGAGHGGAGGGASGPGGPTYGLPRLDDLTGGSGAGATYNKGGGAGGGALALVAAGDLLIDSGASITANGGDGSPSSAQLTSGGGSGGTLLIQGNNVTLRGTLAARGGRGGNASGGQENGGGGGGGRIAIYHRLDLDSDSATLSVEGGSAVGSAGVGQDGQPGSIHTESTLVLEPPQITSHPSDASLPVGATLSLTAEATGDGPFTFQWQRDLDDVPQATLPELRIEEVQLADSGSYTLTVTGPGGSATTLPAEVTIGTPPSIGLPPAQLRFVTGSTATLAAEVSGTGPFVFSWSNPSDPIPGATSQNLVLPAVSEADSGSYRFHVQSPFGAATSEPWTIQVAPAIMQVPAPEHAGDVNSTGFRLNISVMPDTRYLLEYSTDLKLWIPMRELESASGTFFTQDIDAILHPGRFYRVRLAPDL